MTDDGFLSLMSDDGSTKDDVKNPDGEIGEKINKLFNEDGKDTSECLIWRCIGAQLIVKRRYCPHCYGRGDCHRRKRGSQVRLNGLHSAQPGGWRVWYGTVVFLAKLHVVLVGQQRVG